MIKIEVNEGKLPWVIGIGTILFGLLLGAAVIFKPNESGIALALVYMVILLIIAAGIFMCMDGKNRRLVVEDMRITYSGWSGKQKSFMLDEIGYCSTALETKSSRDYLKLYDLNGEKLCKIEYNMDNSVMFLQYLLDNNVKIECSDNSDILLKMMLLPDTITPENIPAKVNEVFEKARELVFKWNKENNKLGADWEMGIAVYKEDMLSDKKQLWEQEGYSLSEEDEHSEELPEGYLIVIESYLMKDRQYVIDKKNRVVSFHIPVVCVSKSLCIGESKKIRFFGSALEELSLKLRIMADMLPRNRYHTEEIHIRHELRQRL